MRSRKRGQLLRMVAIASSCCWIFSIMYMQRYKQIGVTDRVKLNVIQEEFSIRRSDKVFFGTYGELQNTRKPFRPSLPKNYNPNAPGENGTAVIVPAKYKKHSQKLFVRNLFNQWASDRISLHRTLPDARHPMCLNQTFPANLPSTDVIIVFYNEAWSTLLRTVHSVLDRSPPDLLHHIILQDDYSDIKEHANLHAPLERYVATLKKVKIFRNTKREGLIRSRLNGFRHTTASVVTFLDAHCEVNVGWLEPLLLRIYHNPTTVVFPQIDSINDKTFQYMYGPSAVHRGIFNWRLEFQWQIIPAEEQRRRKSPIDPVRSPTMIGGLFSINRENFVRLGKYDEELRIWGGEHMELSFKIWLCGGKLELVPCSRVGHVDRSQLPYKSVRKFLERNSQRVAEVWMDEYKEFFYQQLPHLRSNDYGSITPRLQLRQRLQCKHFKWYLDNVFTDAILPNESSLARGKVKNPQSNMCLNTFDKGNHHHLRTSPCTATSRTMDFSYTVLEELEFSNLCLDCSNSTVGGKIQLIGCHRQGGNQRWLHKQNGNIRHYLNGLCLDRGSGTTPVMMKCTDSASQIWMFDKYISNVNPKKLTAGKLSMQHSELVIYV